MIAILKNGKMTFTDTTANQYTGEKTGGEFNAWRLFGTDPTNFLKGSYGILTSRTATLYHTSSPVRACVNKPLLYSIGDGLLFKSLPNAEMIGITPEEAKEWGKKFTELLHYEKMAIGYYEKQSIIVREAKITGDSITYLLREKNTGVPFDILPTPGDQIDWEMTDEPHNYLLGIKTDQYLRRLGFWSRTSNKYIPFRDDKTGELNAIQFMFQERAGQVRGYSAFYSNIAMAKNLDRVYDATIERMVQEAIQLGYFQASSTDVSGQARQMAKMTRSLRDRDMEIKEMNRGNEMKTGGMYLLQNEENMQFTDLKTPGNNFGLANEWIIKQFAMANSIPPEVLLGEYSTSFTAHKGALNDFVKYYMKERKTFIREVDEKINFEYLKYFIATGQLQVTPEFATSRKIQLAYLEGTHLGPVPGHINPLQEVQADLMAEQNGYTLKSSIATKYGNDFWSMIDPWAEEQDKFFSASPEKQAEAVERQITQEEAQNPPSDTTETTTKEEQK